MVVNSTGGTAVEITKNGVQFRLQVVAPHIVTLTRNEEIQAYVGLVGCRFDTYCSIVAKSTGQHFVKSFEVVGTIHRNVGVAKIQMKKLLSGDTQYQGNARGLSRCCA